MTLSRTRTLMSGVRHHDAPVMPLGPSVFAPDLRHLVGDLDLWLHSDQFLMAITHMHWPSSLVVKKKNLNICRSAQSSQIITAFYKITQTIKLYDHKSILPLNYKSPHFIYPNYKTQSASPHFLLAVAELRKLKRSISFDYQTGLINGSFFSIRSN